MIPLEDGFQDIIGKAQRGLGLSDSDLAQQTGLTRDQIAAVKSGTVDEAALGALARVLRLHSGALTDLAHGRYKPAPVEVPGLACFNTAYQDMMVNAYLAFDPDAREAVVFDTGADADPILDFAGKEGLKISLILITHTHTDHILELDRLREKTGAPAFVGDREAFSGAAAFHAGKTFECGRLRIGTRLTWGHARGGITYVVEGLPRTLAVVGDALFAGSMGGGMISYKDALHTSGTEILGLTDETVICPGHGPLTTVAEEKQHNPFFAR